MTGTWADGFVVFCRITGLTGLICGCGGDTRSVDILVQMVTKKLVNVFERQLTGLKTRRGTHCCAPRPARDALTLLPALRAQGQAAHVFGHRGRRVGRSTRPWLSLLIGEWLRYLGQKETRPGGPRRPLEDRIARRCIEPC